MPYYSFNMKKGKYQVEMTSDDVYFAKRQVDKLFEKLFKTRGKVRVVLPPIDPEEVIKETKESEKSVSIKETLTVKPSVQEKKQTEPVKQEDKTIEPVVKEEEIKQNLPETELPEDNNTEIISEDKDVIEKIDKLLQKEPLEKEKQEIPSEEYDEIDEIDEIENDSEEEITEKKAEEVTQGSLFENILAEKTLEADEEIEEDIEEPIAKETSDEKKKFSFKNIITEKLKNPDSEETSFSRRKAGFKTAAIEEPEIKRVKPQDVISSDDEEDEEIAKILEEKIKKSFPKPEEQDIYLDETDENETLILEMAENDHKDSTTQDFDSLGELLALKNPQTKLDYLLLTAYYLQTKESLFKYSLKQLNAKAMPFLGSLIDHSVIHNAVAHDFIEVVPDYNGTAEVTEYKLTLEGENYLLS